MLEKHQIALLYAGGRQHPLKNQNALNRWNKEFIELEMVATAEPMFIAGHTAPDQPQILQRIARRIQREWNRYDGFIVTMDYAHVLYNANLLAFMLGRLSKPIVISTISHDDLATIAAGAKYPDIGLKASIVNATQMVTAQAAGSFIAFGSSIIPVTHALVSEDKDHPGIYPASSAHGSVGGGYIDFGIQLLENQHALERVKPEIYVAYGERVLYQVLTAGDIKDLQVEKKTRGLILDSRHISLPVSAARLLPKKVPTLVLTSAAVLLYTNGRVTKITGLTPDCAAAKFTWLSGQRSVLAKLKNAMDQDFIGEHLRRVKPVKRAKSIKKRR
ncbi:MAG: asparaginase [Candidatus Kerfeldbacteria bacterium]|nr:asparaginase [Candidatus Kerfeldbacteria bacterium]